MKPARYTKFDRLMDRLAMPVLWTMFVLYVIAVAMQFWGKL